jgi:hypothetical protein
MIEYQATRPARLASDVSRAAMSPTSNVISGCSLRARSTIAAERSIPRIDIPRSRR